MKKQLIRVGGILVATEYVILPFLFSPLSLLLLFGIKNSGSIPASTSQELGIREKKRVIVLFV